MLPPALSPDEDFTIASVASVDSTPSETLRWEQRISKGTQSCVKDVDPNKGRCMIGNHPPHRAVGFVHCVPRKIAKDPQLVCFFCHSGSFRVYQDVHWQPRNHWNMRYGSFNPDTRYNIFRGGPSHIFGCEMTTDYVFTTIDSVGLLFKTLQEKDGPAWMFLPQENVVNQYYDVLIPQDGGLLKANRRTFPHIEVGRT